MTRTFLVTATRVALLAVISFAPACVSQGKYEALSADNDRMRHDSEVVAAERDTARKKLAELSALDAALSARLFKLGTSVSDLQDEKGVLAQALGDARTRLDEARKQKVETESRAARYRGLAKRLAQSIDDGTLDIEARDDRLVLRMRDDVMFDPGSTQVKPAGRKILVEVAEALREYPKRHFQVAGHTDDTPIQTSRFPSNWELSTARAVVVLRVLVEERVPADALSAAGYAAFDPVAPNTTVEGRRRNRRIEITVMPAIRETPALIP